MSAPAAYEGKLKGYQHVAEAFWTHLDEDEHPDRFTIRHSSRHPHEVELEAWKGPMRALVTCFVMNTDPGVARFQIWGLGHRLAHKYRSCLQSGPRYLDTIQHLTFVRKTPSFF